MFKKEKLKVAKVDLDQDLEIPEFDFDLPPPKDDRKPVKKVFDGVISGAKSTLFSKDLLFKTMKKSLPEGFGEAIDLSASVNQSAKKIYNDAANQIKPSLNEMTRAASKLTPSENAKTKKALDSVAKWSENNKSKYSSDDQASQREAGINLAINDVFKFQAEQSIRMAAEENVKSKIQNSLEISRHKDNFGLLNNISLNTSRLSQYQEKVTASFQKKSLEIQYRSYFVAMDALEEAKKQNAITKLSLESIAKNTALPESVKLTAHDNFKDVARNKFWSSVNEGLFGGRNNVVGKISENIGSAIREKLTSAVDAFSMATMAMEGMAMTEGMDNRGRGEKVGDIAGGMGVDYLAGKAGKWLRSKADSNKKTAALGRKVGGLATNAPQHLNEFKRSKAGESNNPNDSLIVDVGNFFVRAFKSVIPNMDIDDSAQSDRADTLTNPYHFTKQTHKSINEVIPGYLSRIFRELQVLRTGDVKTPLHVYDYTKNKFSTSNDAASSLLKSVLNNSGKSAEDLINEVQSNKDFSKAKKDSLIRKIKEDEKNGAFKDLSKTTTQNQLNTIFDLIDPDGSKLDSKARESLSKKLLDDNLNSRLGDSKRLSNADTFSGENTKQYAQLFAETFKSYFSQNENNETILNKKYNAIGSGMNDSRGFIQNMINLGQYDLLKSAGLINEAGSKINLEKLKALQLGESTDIGGNSNSKSKRKIDKRFILSLISRSIPDSKDGSSIVDEIINNDKSSKAQDNNKQNNEEIILTLKDVGLITNIKLEEIKQVLLSKSFDASGSATGGYKNDGSVFGSIKSLSKTGAEMVSSLIKGGHRITKGFVNTIPFNSIKGIATKSFEGVKQGLSFAVDKVRNLSKIRDVFIAGEIEPRISAIKLKAGKYFLEDENGKRTVLKDIDGIKGKIVDEFGATIIALDELGKMFTKNIKGKGFIKLVTNSASWVIGKGNQYSKFMLGLIPPALQSLGNAAASIFNLAKKTVLNLLDEPIDIYVPGNPIPVLTALIMRNGGYISHKTSKPVMRPGEIDGIIRYEDKVVLTLEDIEKGLTDINGNPIKLPFQKIKDFAINSVKKTFAFGQRQVKNLYNIAKAGVKTLGSLVTGGINGVMNGTDAFSMKDSTNKDDTNLLKQIRDLINTRLPGKRTKFNDNINNVGKTKVDPTGLDKKFNDTDGDGTREGSWRTMGKKVKDKTTSIKDNIKNTIADKVAGDKPGIVSKMFNKMMGIKDKDEVAEESLNELTDIKRILLAQAAGGSVGDLLGGGGAEGKGKGAGKVAGKAGRLSRLASGAARIGGKILPGASLALGAAGAYANIKDGNYGAAAVDAGLGLGGFALTGGSLAGLAGGIATGAGAIAGGIGALLSSPVILGALAVAAVGTIGYMAYKALTKDKSKLGIMRYVQYGFSSKDTQYFSQIQKLENSLIEKNIKYESGIARLVDKDFDIKKAIEIFGVSQENEKDFNNWISWFTGRFKPVFLTHLTSLKKIGAKVNLSDIDDLTDEEKLKYFKQSSFIDGPYDYKDSPIPVIEQLPSGLKEVKEAIAEVEKALSKNKKDDKKTLDSSIVPVEKSLSKGESLVDQANQPTNIDSEITKRSGIMSFFENQGKMIATPLMAIGSVVGRFLGFNATPLETVRFKTYGLKTLERSKVSALRSLEESVFKDIKFNSNGGADWSSTAEVIIRYAGKDFGVDNASSVLAKPWLTWFTKRFLPVYLSYLGLLKQKTGKEEQRNAEQSLKSNQQLEIATKISAADVWSVTTSPWEGYVLSSDAKEVSENLALMREKSEKDEMIDAKKPATEQKKTIASQSQSSTNQKVNPEVKDKIDSKGTTDIETPITGTSNSENKSGGSSNATKAAGGPLLDGTHATQYIKLAPGVSLSGMNPELMKNFNGMVEEYGNKTGNSVYVNSGFRSYTKQMELYKKDPSKAAKPGSSLHEYGLALDVSSSTLNELDKMGLMTKYGFTRPVGGETWHMEPAGIQTNIALAKSDPSFASNAISSSLGKGGGGYGSTKSTPLGKRNPVMARQLLENSSSPTASQADSTVTASAPANSQVLPSRGYVNSVNKTSVNAPDAENGKVEDLKTTVPGSSGALANIPDPGTGKGLEAVRPTIEAAAKATGVDPKLMLGVAGIESSFDPSAKAKTSSASGLYQFTSGTWKEMVSKNGSKYGISPDTSPMNAKANALMGGEYLKANMKTISKNKPDPTNTDLYMAHFLGGSGANKLFSADPNAAASEVLPKAAESNKSIFFNGNTPRTTSELYSLMDNKVNKQLSGLGLDSRPSKQTLKPPTNIVNPTTSSVVSLNDSLGGNETAVTPATIKPQNGLKSAMTSSASPVGFNDQTSQSQPQQDARYDMNKAMGSVNDTLKQSLTVQTNMYSVLKDILNTVNPKAIANAMKEAKVDSQSQDKESNVTASNSTRSNINQSGPRNVKSVPVPMSRQQT